MGLTKEQGFKLLELVRAFSYVDGTPVDPERVNTAWGNLEAFVQSLVPDALAVGTPVKVLTPSGGDTTLTGKIEAVAREAEYVVALDAAPIVLGKLTLSRVQAMASELVVLPS